MVCDRVQSQSLNVTASLNTAQKLIAATPQHEMKTLMNEFSEQIAKLDQVEGRLNELYHKIYWLEKPVSKI